jgi:hypothetical protein
MPNESSKQGQPNITHGPLYSSTKMQPANRRKKAKKKPSGRRLVVAPATNKIVRTL